MTELQAQVEVSKCLYPRIGMPFTYELPNMILATEITLNKAPKETKNIWKYTLEAFNTIYRNRK